MPTRREINELYAAANSLKLVTKERDELRAELAASKASMNELRKAVAEIIGTDPATWPVHGNASLAIAANIALMRAELDAIKQQNPAAWREFDGEGNYTSATLKAMKIARQSGMSVTKTARNTSKGG